MQAPAGLRRRDYDRAVRDGIDMPFDRPAPDADDVRDEAGRRILARYPRYAQLNMAARGTELVFIGQTNWTEAEAAEAADLQIRWNWIKSVRAASNAMEPDPPEDFAEDSRWPD